MSDRKVVLYICNSLDGFLATKDDDLSWLSCIDKEGEDYGYKAFNETVDAYIVGKTTYEVVLKLTGGTFPSSEGKDSYVITRHEKAPENGVQFYTKPLKELIQSLKAKPGKNIFCDGGAQIVKMLLEEDLIDEFIITVIPILLGDGKRLFKGGTPTLNLELVTTKSYDTGVVQLHYKRKR